MAAGRSRRFGENKLLIPFRGRPLVASALGTLASVPFCSRAAVARSDEVLALAAQAGFAATPCPAEVTTLPGTIALGLASAPAQALGCLFAVADQPLLSRESLLALLDCFLCDPSRIAALGRAGRRGNPVVFPRALFGELASIPADRGGSHVIERHPGRLVVVEAADPAELSDADTPEALESLR